MEINYEADLENPVTFTLENKTGENKAIRYFRVNFTEVLKPEDKIILTVTTSEELAYYTKLQEGLEGNAKTKMTSKDYITATLKYFNAPEFTVSDEERGSGEIINRGFDIGDESIPEDEYTAFYHSVHYAGVSGNFNAMAYINDARVITEVYNNRGAFECKFENDVITNSYFEEHQN